jgi:hypothetical protein
MTSQAQTTPSRDSGSSSIHTCPPACPGCLTRQGCRRHELHDLAPRIDDPANMSQATIDSHVIFTPPIHDWLQDPARGFQDREVQFRVAGRVPQATFTRLSDSLYYPPSVRSTSSMAPQIHQSHASDASDLAPSLRYCSTITESSMSTSLVNQCAGYPLLEEGADGVLLQPNLEVASPQYECAFWFLSCSFLSRDEQEWDTHCLSHFRGKEPPCSVQCPLCDWRTTCEEGLTAWSLRMQHLSSHHLAFGQTLRTSRPDFHLFQYLWQQHLIGDADLKELKGGNHNLNRPPENFVATNYNPARRERDNVRRVPRERSNDQRGLQHVPARRH